MFVCYNITGTVWSCRCLC